MRKLTAFMQVSLDGHFAGANDDISWAHRDGGDPEWKAFIEDNARSGGELLFGRKTYDLMVKYWPTKQAADNEPVVAESMNQSSKVVFSRTIDRPSWRNTTVVKDDMAGTVRQMKQQDGEPLVILGSGSIVSQLAQAGLIDELQLVVNPVALGEGKTLLDGIKDPL